MNFGTYTALEQFASRVLEITNRYSSFNHVSYDPGNFCGKCTRYPAYGDFPETYALRKYGKWWKLTEANYQKPYRETDIDPLGVEDFVTVRFNEPVIPTRLFIYETYSPGSIVRIWGRLDKGRWVLMWEGKPQYCTPVARKFQPVLRKLSCFIDTIRLELNCSGLNHHACFDAILLIGFSGPGTEFQMQCLKALNAPLRGPTTDDEVRQEVDRVNHFDKLPPELKLYIFRFLDLKSLSMCACVSSGWNKLAIDPLLYQNISFKEYWQVVDSRVFDFLEKKCEVLKKLDLSWCGRDDQNFARKLYQFLHWSCYNLTHISLENATYFNGSHLTAICSSCSELEELRLKNVYISDLIYVHAETVCKLTKLVTLDLGCTNISSHLLIPLLMTNPNLTYLNLDFCEIGPLDELVRVISEYNTKLRGFSCWKGRRLTASSANLLGRCHQLEDLDLGWCLNAFPEEDTLEGLAKGCRGLRRLIISAWRPLVDSMLFPIIQHCTGLEQLDVLSITGITPEFVERALLRLPKLKLLEVSYCDSISLKRVQQWRTMYPHVTIQKCLEID
ncbi:F-box/LRR-repeat protein 4 [Coccinella septempunctata]|uniref:F-box/LRR-repeat protein 4 n=1 Tax=Coccinella septempunctata TaxID=41139 RepID=UPI001D0628F2|nr:F-box/LRR-repeat protein 4 [Coccinella septempunctata]